LLREKKDKFELLFLQSDLVGDNKEIGHSATQVQEQQQG
jgi:hypothetical protein